MDFFGKIKNFFNPSASVQQYSEYALGALPNDESPDVRDINVSQVQTPVQLPETYESPIKDFPVLNQGFLGTCVAHAFALLKAVADFMETGSFILYSRRFIYSLAHKISGLPVNTQGLYPRDAGKTLAAVGAVKDSGFDDNNLPHDKYLALTVTETMLTDANIAKAKGFAGVDVDEHSLKQAIFQNKGAAVTIPIDWSKIEADGTFRIPKKIEGSHEIVAFGWTKDAFIVRNHWGSWWGTKGNGFIKFSEVENIIRDATVIIDLPNDLKERAKLTQYIFLTDLKLGMRNDAVKQLQKRLIEMGFLNSDITGYFGNLTKIAVQQYQYVRGIMTTGTVGPLTRKALNADSSTVTVKSKIDLWCQATEKMEGAKPSWNNPGNIRYIGQASVSAVYDMSNKKTITDRSKFYLYKNTNSFCIFPDYATGYMELRKIFTNACLGKSKVYSPDMTLTQFYQKYAPSSDNNDPLNYARFVAKFIGVSPDTQIRTLL